MATTTKTIPFDASRFIADPADQIDLLNDAFESGSAAVVAITLGDIAKARGMTDVARKVGVTRAGLYKALSEDGNARLSTFLGILTAMDIELVARPKAAAKPASAKPILVKGKLPKIAYKRPRRNSPMKVMGASAKTSTRGKSARA